MTAAAPTSTEEAAWSACRRQLSSGSALLAVQHTAAAHWTLHVQAQLKFTAHTFTAAQAHAQWEASKAHGPQDITDNARDDPRYRALSTSCAQLSQAVPASRAAVARRCLTYAGEQAKAIAAGRVVVGQWATHQYTMGHREGMTEHGYLDTWYALVKQAVPALKAFAADQHIGPAPDCSPT